MKNVRKFRGFLAPQSLAPCYFVGKQLTPVISIPLNFKNIKFSSKIISSIFNNLTGLPKQCDYKEIGQNDHKATLPGNDILFFIHNKILLKSIFFERKKTGWGNGNFSVGNFRRENKYTYSRHLQCTCLLRALLFFHSSY